MQSNTQEVLNQLRKTIQCHRLLSEGDSVLVGFSGGADSVCLLHALFTLKKELGVSVAAAHVNHGIRTEGAKEDAAFAKDFCKAHKIPFFLKEEDVPAFAQAQGVSEETAGRLLRYTFFKEVCSKKHFSKIATAHNKNDQAETMLMRILRGSGIEGLGGIRYFRKDGVIRPLLDVKRAQIEGYCEENGLTFCKDVTNEDNTYTRNRIRNRLIPQLQEEFNPQVVDALANLADNMAEDGDFIQGYAERLYRRINNPAPSKKPVVLHRETLSLVPKTIRRRLLSLAAKDAMDKHYTLTHSHVLAVEALLEKETGSAVSLPKGLCVSVQYEWLAFETEAAPPFSNPVEATLELGKVYDFDPLAISMQVMDMPVEKREGQMVLDYEKIQHLPLEIRTRHKGDRIAVYQDGKGRKLKDFLIDKKVERKQRDQLALLCSGAEVLAIIGYRVAEPYKPNKDTKRGLVIRYE